MGVRGNSGFVSWFPEVEDCPYAFRMPRLTLLMNAGVKVRGIFYSRDGHILHWFQAIKIAERFRLLSGSTFKMAPSHKWIDHQFDVDDSANQ